MAAVPVDFDFLNLWGLLLDDDETVLAGQSVTRTLTLKMVPTIAATATATLVSGGGTGIASVTLTNPGELYAAPPVVTFAGIVNEPPCDEPERAPASAVAVMEINVDDFVLIHAGSGYVTPIAVLSQGQLVPGGTPVQVTLTEVGGHITGVTIVPGGPYIIPPIVTVTDAGGGTGAEIVLGMSVSSINVTSVGFGYMSAPAVVITPLFKQMVPDTANQAGIVASWMRGEFENALKLPVDTLTPVVT